MLTFKLNESIPVKLTHYQWNNVIRPDTNVILCLKDDGLHLHYEVQETNPHITVPEQIPEMPKVCLDSAVEIFLSFPNSPQDKDFSPYIEKSFYTNIEMNAVGVCAAKYGMSRKNRIAYTPNQIASLKINARQHADYWSLDLVVPRSLISELIGFDGFAPGSEFAFNLYKISETKEFEHYLSFNKIDNPTPNFHLPQFFARAHVAP